MLGISCMCRDNSQLHISSMCYFDNGVITKLEVYKEFVQLSLVFKKTSLGITSNAKLIHPHFQWNS